MPIRFQCTNTAQYDEATGSYVTCGQPLEAQIEQAGKRVRCPQCKQPVTVPEAENLADAHSDAFAATVPQESLQVAGFDPSVRCIKCGTPLTPKKRCPGCGHQERMLVPDKRSIESIPVEPAGFQLWCKKRLSGGVSFRVVANAMHAMFAVIVILLSLMAVLVAGAGGVVALVFIAGVVVLYILCLMEARRLGTQRVAKPGVLLRPLWALFLLISRRTNWKNFVSSESPESIADLRNAPISDRDLITMEELQQCNVLDLEGTEITDQGLQYLRGMKNIKALVVGKTHVTEEAVFRLQQSIPTAWIWC